MEEKIRDSHEKSVREYITILGKKVLRNTYPKYIHYLIKFGRLTLGKSKTIEPKDYWRIKSSNDFPIRLRLKSIQVGKGTVKLMRIFCFRYLFDIGWLFKTSQNPISRGIKFLQKL